MVRAHVAADATASLRLVYSVKDADRAMYRDGLLVLEAPRISTTWAYTREAPRDWAGTVGRLSATVLAEALHPASVDPVSFVRANAVRGVRRRNTCRAGISTRAHPHREVRGRIMSLATHPLPEPPATPRPSMVDGNALIGILEEAFGAATATLALTCGSCADASALANSVVELAPTSAIVRCRRCTHTILTLRWSEHELVIDGASAQITVRRGSR